MAKLRINNFTGQKDNGFYWTQSMSPVILGDRVGMGRGCHIIDINQRGNTNLTHLGLVSGFCSASPQGSNKVYGSSYHTDGQYIVGAIATTFTELFKANGAEAGGTAVAAQFGDIKPFTISGTESLIYTSLRHLGKTTDNSDQDNLYQTLDATATAQDYRQIEIWEDTAFIGNGNYIASLDDSGNFNALHKQLPTGYKFRCMAQGGSYLAVGMNKDYEGQIGLWDSYSDGWNYLNPLKNKVVAIRPYSNGWIYISGSALFFTDGYNSRLLSYFPDANERSQDIEICQNGMEIINNKVIISGNIDGTDRRKVGIWIYDLSNESWDYSPYKCGTGVFSLYDNNPGAIYYSTMINYIYSSFQVNENITNPYYIGLLFINSRGGVGGANEMDNVLITPPIYFDNNVLLNYCKVNYIVDPKITNKSRSPSFDMTLNISDAIKPTWHYAETNASATAENLIQINGSSDYVADVGDEILVLEGKNGGQRSHIASIANSGTATEQWTLNDNLKDKTEKTILVNILPFERIGKQTINSYQDNYVYFDCGGKEIHNAAMLELITKNTDTYPIIINSITLEYEPRGEQN